jgi:hypothetical protein
LQTGGIDGVDGAADLASWHLVYTWHLTAHLDTLTPWSLYEKGGSGTRRI